MISGTAIAFKQYYWFSDSGCDTNETDNRQAVSFSDRLMRLGYIYSSGTAGAFKYYWF